MLSDGEKREKYDRFGADFNRYQQAGNASGFDWSQYGGGTTQNWGEYGGGAPNGGFSDFFETLFGGAGGRRGTMAQKGQDYEQAVDVTLEEVLTGTQRQLRLEVPQTTGQTTTRTITVKIPAGAEIGTRVRVGGEGGSGVGGGPKGDLLLVINVLPQTGYERTGQDLRLRQPIDVYSLLLGGEVKITLLNGKTLSLKIPEHTPNGKIFRVRGQGMPRLNKPDERGDLFVIAEARLPTQLSPRQRELLAEVRDMA